MHFIAVKSLSASLENGPEPVKKARKKRQAKDVAPAVTTDVSIEAVSLKERDGI